VIDGASLGFREGGKSLFLSVKKGAGFKETLWRQMAMLMRGGPESTRAEGGKDLPRGQEGGGLVMNAGFRNRSWTKVLG